MKDKHASLLRKSTLKSHQGMPMKVLSLNLHSLADLSMIACTNISIFPVFPPSKEIQSMVKRILRYLKPKTLGSMLEAWII